MHLIFKFFSIIISGIINIRYYCIPWKEALCWQRLLQRNSKPYVLRQKRMGSHRGNSIEIFEWWQIQYWQSAQRFNSNYTDGVWICISLACVQDSRKSQKTFSHICLLLWAYGNSFSISPIDHLQSTRGQWKFYVSLWCVTIFFFKVENACFCILGRVLQC